MPPTGYEVKMYTDINNIYLSLSRLNVTMERIANALEVMIDIMPTSEDLRTTEVPETVS